MRSQPLARRGCGEDGLTATEGADQVRAAGRGPSCHDRDVTGRNGGAEIVEFGSVPGFVVFDLPGAPLSAGGTRLAPDVSVAEVAVLARSMTYKFAALRSEERRVGKECRSGGWGEDEKKKEWRE